MGCLNVLINKVSESLNVITMRVDTPMSLHVADVGRHLQVTCGIVCSINNSEYLLKFEKATLFWNSSDNRVGTTKYNTLVATGNWTLEEIQIEELL